MKMLSRILYYFLLSTVFTGAVQLDARIGDSRSNLEKRLESSRLYLRENWEDPAVKKRIKNHPIPHIESLLADSSAFEIVYYFKKDGPENLKQQEKKNVNKLAGWDFFVVYRNRVSVMEIFIRRNETFTQVEFEQILLRNNAGSVWKSLDKDDKIDEEQLDLDGYSEIDIEVDESEMSSSKIENSFINCNYILANNAIRAKKSRHSLILTMTSFDKLLYQEKEKQTPEILKGF